MQPRNYRIHGFLLHAAVNARRHVMFIWTPPAPAHPFRTLHVTFTRSLSCAPTINGTKERRARFLVHPHTGGTVARVVRMHRGFTQNKRNPGRNQREEICFISRQNRSQHTLPLQRGGSRDDLIPSLIATSTNTFDLINFCVFIRVFLTPN